MKKVLFITLFLPFLIFGSEKIPSKIKAVTVYQNSAEITRQAIFTIENGTSELVFTGLSSKIDESSIQISGLQAASILSISYDINYLDKPIINIEVDEISTKIKTLELKISMLKNKIAGLDEEEVVIIKNRTVSATNQNLDLEKLKTISTYYRERITAIRNEIFSINSKINELSLSIKDYRNQLAEKNSVPIKPKGEISIKFDTPITSNLTLEIKYNVQDAGWIPNYDIKSNKLNDPLQFIYKAHVYQKTGENWNDVALTLSSGNPNILTIKPTVNTDYLNFGHRKSYLSQVKKQKYTHNPTVKKVSGIVTDESGTPLPGCNVVIKGTNIGTQTDFDGFYTLDTQAGQELVFSHLGFNTNETPIYSSRINLNLEENLEALEEVIIVGYGSREKSNITRALSGKVSGIQIRGASSVTKASQPLYIIDGVPVEGFEEGDLDVSEIQDIEILNNEVSIEIYGSRATNGIVLISTKKSTSQEDVTSTKFSIKKPCSITSDGDLSSIEINTFKLDASYEFFAAPVINENVFLTARFKDWEKLNLLPGEANVYFNGSFAGKTTIDPYTINKEMTVSLGVDDAITITRKQDRNFKSKSFTGNNRILNRTYNLEIKNNKSNAIDVMIMDRIPISQNKEIKVEDIITNNAIYDEKKGLLTWKMKLNSKEEAKESFSFQVKYPKERHITL